MADVGAVADALKAGIEAGGKIADRHDHHVAEVDGAAAGVRAPLPDPSPLPVAADKSLCSFCQSGSHSQHFSAGCVTPVQAIQSGCRCEVVTEQQKLLAGYEARIADLGAIANAKNADQLSTAWAKYWARGVAS